MITGNKSKYQEMARFIPGLKVIDFDLPEIQEVDAHKVIVAKLTAAQKHAKHNYIVEDTSLYLDCLNGLPGPLIKWFQATIGIEGIADLAQKYNNTKASAKTVIGYMSVTGEMKYFEGVSHGNIVMPRGESGFGWDPIFQPQGYTVTHARMTHQQKAAVSMRKIAARKLAEYLNTQA